ncbi:MAG: cyclic nucleotide-binding domain-containing protein [Proteobacteria bacterium]|nr:cyclic nucleotide-binding domain-containing protein [Pseudomonadota bacterium]MCP4919258.1 cyclic nucleotide-binding domain-containing protein [Pseudomonadota bacterium]
MLEQFKLFRGLSESDREIVERVMVVEERRPGHVFLREGERGTAGQAALYVVIEGDIQVVSAAPPGGYGVDRLIGPGQIFGLVSLLDDAPRSATCTAATPVKVGKLTRAVMNSLLKTHAKVHVRFQRMVCSQLAQDLRALDERLRKAVTGESALDDIL